MYEVYKENLEKGKRIFPWMGPTVLNQIDSLYPLSGVSNIDTIFCNEVGNGKFIKVINMVSIIRILIMKKILKF